MIDAVVVPWQSEVVPGTVDVPNNAVLAVVVVWPNSVPGVV